MAKPLYFLTHEGNARMFSGYGIPLNDGEKSPLVGMLMIDRPQKCPDSYIREIRNAFGEAIVGPMTLHGDMGLFTQMKIEDPASIELVRDDLYGPKMNEIRYVLDLALKGGGLPKTKLTKGYWFTHSTARTQPLKEGEEARLRVILGKPWPSGRRDEGFTSKRGFVF